jgi:hypothetical protein
VNVWLTAPAGLIRKKLEFEPLKNPDVYPRAIKYGVELQFVRDALPVILNVFPLWLPKYKTAFAAELSKYELLNPKLIEFVSTVGVNHWFTILLNT